MSLLLMAAAVALAVDPGPTEGSQASDTTAAAIVADCNARKFETRVEIEKDGQKRLTKLKLCAAKEGDDASWLRTLEDAKAKIAVHPDISVESKAKIAAELDAEIAKLRTGNSGSNSAAAIVPPVSRVSESATPPPLPPAPAAEAKSTLTKSPAPAPAKPRLTVRCLDVGETGGGSPCSLLERGTRLAIHADGDLTGDTRLRFLRRGDERGEVVLAAMRQGQSIRSKLPDRLCVGVSSSKVEIQVLSSGKVVETLGPYRLLC